MRLDDRPQAKLLTEVPQLDELLAQHAAAMGSDAVASQLADPSSETHASPIRARVDDGDPAHVGASE